MKRRDGWTPSTAGVLHTYTNTYTHTYPWSVPLLVSQVVLRFDLDTVGQPEPPSLPFLFSLPLLHFISVSLALSSLPGSGSVSLPAAVCMAGPTALGCLGSGGIPISSSNHDIILPQ